MQITDGSTVINVDNLSSLEGTFLEPTYLNNISSTTPDFNIYFENATRTSADLMIRMNNSNFDGGIWRVSAIYMLIRSREEIVPTSEISFENYAYNDTYYNTEQFGQYIYRFTYQRAIGTNYGQLVVLNATSDLDTFKTIYLRQDYGDLNGIDNNTFVVKIGTFTRTLPPEPEPEPQPESELSLIHI